MNVPEIRFKGFTGAWVQRKLGESKDVRDGTHDSPKYHTEGFPLITSKNLSDEGLDFSDISLISKKDFEAINRRSKVDIGDILFGMIGTIGNPVIIDSTGFAIKNVALIKDSGEFPNTFLIQLLKSPIFDGYIKLENAGGTQKFLGLNKIRDFVFLSPTTCEQVAIGNFFGVLDHTITLHQRKLDRLRELKKGYLQQMFPQAGEKVPRIRFKGFSEDWQEKRLGEVGNISAGGDIDKSKIEIKGVFAVIANALSNDGIVGYYKDYKIKAPAVTITGRGDVGYAKARHENFTPVVRLLTLKPNNDFDVDFLEEAINTLDFFVESTGVPQLTSPQLSEYIISAPALTEQVAIGNFFQNLDSQITAQKTKLAQMKKLKSAYLQKMFI